MTRAEVMELQLPARHRLAILRATPVEDWPRHEVLITGFRQVQGFEKLPGMEYAVRSDGVIVYRLITNRLLDMPWRLSTPAAFLDNLAWELQYWLTEAAREAQREDREARREKAERG